MFIKRVLAPITLAFAFLIDLQISLIHSCNAIHADFFTPQGALLSSGLRDLMICYAMPLYPFIVNLASHLPPSLDCLPIFAASTLLSIMIYAAGSYLRSPMTGALAAALFSLSVLYDLQHGQLLLWDINYLETLLYALSCTCAACALVVRASSRVRSIGTEALVGAAIGISFMIRSPLCLLPLALAASDVASGKLSRRETTWLNLCVLCAVPFLFLLPWVFMNYSVWGKFLLFEYGRATSNVISGAMGIIWTVEGAIPLAGFDPSESLAGWAVKTVLEHPVRYCGSVLARGYTIVSWYPSASALLAASAVYFRKDARFRAIFFFAAYFLGLHIMLSIEPRYFFPLWPVLLLAMAAFLSPVRGVPRSRSSGFIFAAIMSVFIVLYMAVSFRLLAYSRNARAEPPLSTAAASTAEPVALVRLAQTSMNSGRPDDACAYARKALLTRASEETYSQYFYALISRGVDISVPLKRAERYFTIPSTDYLQLEAANLYLTGHPAEGRLKLVMAVNRRKMTFKKILSQEEAALYRKQQADSLFMIAEQTMGEFFSNFPVKLAKRLEGQILSETSVMPEMSARELIIGGYLSKARQITDIDYSLRGQLLTDTPEFKSLLDSTAASLEAPKVSLRAFLAFPSLPKDARHRELGRLVQDGEAVKSLELLSAFHNRSCDGPCGIFMQRLFFVLVRRASPSSLREAEYIASRLTQSDLAGICASADPLVLKFFRGINVSSGLPAYANLLIDSFLPEGRQRFLQIEEWHSTGQYARLIEPARKYLREYPYDKVATLYLATALIVTHDYCQAQFYLDSAAKMRLELHEVKWRLQLQENLEAELSRNSLDISTLRKSCAKKADYTL